MRPIRLTAAATLALCSAAGMAGAQSRSLRRRHGLRQRSATVMRAMDRRGSEAQARGRQLTASDDRGDASAYFWVSFYGCEPPRITIRCRSGRFTEPRQYARVAASEFGAPFRQAAVAKDGRWWFLRRGDDRRDQHHLRRRVDWWTAQLGRLADFFRKRAEAGRSRQVTPQLQEPSS